MTQTEYLQLMDMVRDVEDDIEAYGDNWCGWPSVDTMCDWYSPTEVVSEAVREVLARAITSDGRSLGVDLVLAGVREQPAPEPVELIIVRGRP